MSALNLAVGDQIKFLDDRFWWTARAVDDRYAVLTRHTPFRKDGILTYTIIDAERGRRGPCNLIGQGWGFDIDKPEEGAEELLAELQADKVQITSRNNVPTVLTDRKAAK